MKFLPILFGMLLALPCLAAGNSLPIATQFGATTRVPSGAEVSLKLPEHVTISDAVMDAFVVKDAGGEPFEISTGGDYRGNGVPLRLTIRVTNAAGKVLPDACRDLRNFGGMMGKTRLALGESLEDPDWGVLRTACEVAGKSGRKEFIRPLCQGVETTHESFVLSAASDAARTLGARTELWNAWCEVITDKDFMSQAMRELALGTLDLPTGASSANSNFTRAQRFAIRDAWRAFLGKNHALLTTGKRLPPGDSSVTPAMSGADIDPQNPAIQFWIKDGRSWPEKPAGG